MTCLLPENGDLFLGGLELIPIGVVHVRHFRAGLVRKRIFVWRRQNRRSNTQARSFAQSFHNEGPTHSKKMYMGYYVNQTCTRPEGQILFFPPCIYRFQTRCKKRVFVDASLNDVLNKKCDNKKEARSSVCILVVQTTPSLWCFSPHLAEAVFAA